MGAIVLERARTLKEYRLDPPSPTDDHVMVRMETVCLQDDDLDSFSYGRGKLPRVLGCAGIGTVVEAEPVTKRDTQIIPFFRGDARRPTAGTRVLVWFSPQEDGALREYVAIPAERCHPLPTTIPDGRLALIPDVAKAVGILDHLGTEPGDIMAVLGARASGVVLALTAAHRGLSVILVDPNRGRLTTAEELGVMQTVNPIAASLGEEIAWFGNGRLDYVVDTSGDPEHMPGALAAMHAGSVLGLIQSFDYPFSFAEVVETGITIQGLSDVMPNVSAAVQPTEELPLERLVSRSVPAIDLPAELPKVMRERGSFFRMTGIFS